MRTERNRTLRHLIGILLQNSIKKLFTSTFEKTYKLKSGLCRGQIVAFHSKCLLRCSFEMTNQFEFDLTFVLMSLEVYFSIGPKRKSTRN